MTKKPYVAPILEAHGTIAALTAAVGPGGQNDQSDFPDQFPPSEGSFDICDNDNPNSVC